MNKVSANWFFPRDRAIITTFIGFFTNINGILSIIIPGIWFSGYSCLDDDVKDVIYFL